MYALHFPSAVGEEWPTEGILETHTLPHSQGLIPVVSAYHTSPMLQRCTRHCVLIVRRRGTYQSSPLYSYSRTTERFCTFKFEISARYLRMRARLTAPPHAHIHVHYNYALSPHFKIHHGKIRIDVKILCQYHPHFHWLEQSHEQCY